MLDVGTEVLDDDVGLGAEPLDDVDPGRRLEVERQGALVAVQVLGVEAAPDEIAFGVLAGRNLDDVGAHVGELAHAGRARARASEIDHGVRVEGQAHREGAPCLMV
jgi:hypothetical protein